MAQRDRTAVDVDPQRIPFQHFPDRDRLCSKGFIDFNQIYIVQLPARPLKTAARGIDRGDPH